MGQEHHRLAGFRQLFRIQLGDHDGQRYGDDHAQDDENRVVYQRVAQHRFEIAGFEQKLEILKAHPIAIVDQAPQKAPARARAVVLEGDDHAKHGRVAEDDVPNRGAKTAPNCQRTIRRTPRSFACLFAPFLVWMP